MRAELDDRRSKWMPALCAQSIRNGRGTAEAQALGCGIPFHPHSNLSRGYSYHSRGSRGSELTVHSKQGAELEEGCLPGKPCAFSCNCSGLDGNFPSVYRLGMSAGLESMRYPC